MVLVGEHDAHAFEKYYEIGHSGAALNIQFKNIGEEHGAWFFIFFIFSNDV